MKARLLAGLYLALVAYCALSAIFGAAGVQAERLSRARIEEMRANLARLEAGRAALEARLEALSGDPEVLLLEARDLGFLGPHERVVKGLGAPSARLEVRSGGTLLAFERPQAPSDRDLKLAAALIGLAGFALGLVAPTGAGRERQAGRSHAARPLHLGRKSA